jgi:hypothetical protein
MRNVGSFFIFDGFQVFCHPFLITNYDGWVMVTVYIGHTITVLGLVSISIIILFTARNPKFSAFAGVGIS